MNAAAETPTMELAIVIKGEIVESNFESFAENFRQQVAELPTELATSEDFALAETNVKRLKEVEASLVEAKAEALKQAEDFQKLFDGIDGLSSEARETRLVLERQIKDQKAQIKADIITAAVEQVEIRVDAAMRGRIEGAAKGKRTMNSMREACEAEAEAINGEVEAAQHMLEVAQEAHGVSIIHGEDQLIRMQVDALEVELERRVERMKAEAEQAKLKADAEKARAALEAEQAQQKEPLKQEPTHAPEGRQANAPALAPAPAVEISDEGREELKEYMRLFGAAVAPFKSFREGVEDPVAKAVLEGFAERINAGWIELKEAAK